MIKIQALVRTCKDCTNRYYRSGGIYECLVTQTDLNADSSIPVWCPLADHPATVIEQQADRIAALESAAKAAVPTGWKLVPVDPTMDMVIDGFESAPSAMFSKPEDWGAFEAMSGCQQAAHKARLCYAAMLAAAPAAIENGDGRDAERYRWLRANWGYLSETYDGNTERMVSIEVLQESHIEDGWPVDPVSLDEAIDAALSQHKQEGNG